MGSVIGAVASGLKGIRQKTNEAPSQVTRGSDFLFNEAKNAYGKIPTTPYAGEYFASATPDSIQAQRGMLRQAGQIQQQGYGQQMSNLGQAQLRGDYLSPGSNPYLQQNINAANKTINQNFQEQVVPQFNNLVSSNNAYDNVRSGILASQLGERNQNQIADVTGQMLMDNYNRERQIQQQSPGLINAGIQNQMLPFEIQDQVGREVQSNNQIGNQNQLAQYKDSVTAPTQGLSQVLPFMGQSMQVQGGTTTEPGANPIGGLIQGGLGGLSAWKGLTTAGPNGQPAAMQSKNAALPWAFGAGGALAGAFGG